MESAPTAPVSDPLLGQMIDERYQVLSLISRGGMATVYRALDCRLDREVALKVMHPHLAESTDLVARFRREARATARLTHPGVVAVYDQGVVNGSGYLVMELISGPNLRYVLRSEGSLTVQTAFDMIEQILSALASAHNSGLIHRDVKPENVLVPSWKELKVVDFGLARAVSDVTMASTGSVLGTVGYLAPELVTGGNVNPRSDVYSVGIMLYELIAGKLPYSAESPIQVAFAHVHKDVPALSEELEWIPSEVDDLIAALCARNSEERPEDAGAALEYVMATRQSLPKEVLERRADVPPSITEAEITAESKKRESLESVTKALDYGHGTTALPITESVEELKKRKKRKVLTWVIVASLLVLLLGGGAGGYAYWYYEHGPGSFIAVPDVSGITQSQAETRLKGKQIDFEIVEEYSDTVSKGLVTRSEPASGMQMSKHATLKVFVSLGIEYVTVPNVIDSPLSKAEQDLRANKLHISKTTEEYDEKIASGNVISISPGVGEVLKHDSQVEVVVSKGRQPLEVPNLAGKSQGEAEQVLSDLGLLSSAKWEINDSVPRGQVASQNPAPGETLYKGDTVSFVISRGPAYIEIPNFRGTNPDRAKEKLESLGFTVEMNHDYEFFYLVRGTSPAAGTKAANGSKVTIYIG